MGKDPAPRIRAVRLLLAAAWIVPVVLPTLAGAVILDGPLPEQERPAIRKEIKGLQAVIDGVRLTLAACESEPHCVTGLSQAELKATRKTVRDRIGQLQDMDDSYANLLSAYRYLEKQLSELIEPAAEVEASVDPDELEGDWADQFRQAEEDTGPDIPAPNRTMTLKRFQDLNEPLPIQ
jgi:hypothetical protein